MKKIFLLLSILFLLISCGNNKSKVIGEWATFDEIFTDKKYATVLIEENDNQLMLTYTTRYKPGKKTYFYGKLWNYKIICNHMNDNVAKFTFSKDYKTMNFGFYEYKKIK